MDAVCNRRLQLFQMINQVTFALDDILLYLDTHPKDSNALEYYHHMLHLRKKAVKEYETQFGPLTIFGENSLDYWRWAKSPWPWERGYC